MKIDQRSTYPTTDGGRARLWYVAEVWSKAKPRHMRLSSTTARLWPRIFMSDIGTLLAFTLTLLSPVHFCWYIPRVQIGSEVVTNTSTQRQHRHHTTDFNFYLRRRRGHRGRWVSERVKTSIDARYPLGQMKNAYLSRYRYIYIV